MGCVDRDFLQALYKKAVDDYVAVAKDLRAHALGIPHEEFMFLWHAAERAKDRSAEAQRLLQLHIAQHECTPRYGHFSFKISLAFYKIMSFYLSECRAARSLLGGPFFSER